MLLRLNTSLFYVEPLWKRFSSSSKSISSSRFLRHYTTANSSEKQWNVVLFGGDAFSLPTLRELIRQRDEGLGVKNLEVLVTELTEGVKERQWLREEALKAGLVVHTCPNKVIKRWACPNFFGRFPERNDVAVVVSFKHFLPTHILDKFPAAALNIHPSLLPKYRGAAPLQHALMNGDEETGVSIIDLDPHRFDAGRIFLQSRYQIPPGTTYEELFRDLSEQGAQDLIKVLSDLDTYSSLAIPQDAALITKAPKICKEHGLITLDMSPREIWCKHAGIGHQAPIYFKGKEPCQITGLVNLEADPTQSSLPEEERVDTLAKVAGIDMDDVPVGTLLYRPKKKCEVIWIKCRDGWLGATSFKVGERKATTAIEFRNGRLKHAASGNVNILDVI